MAFVREILAGTPQYEAFKVAFPKVDADPNLSAPKKGGISSGLMRDPQIVVWIEYLKTATPENLIEDVYLNNLAFGTVKESMNAAKQYLESQFAGKEVAEVFIKCLQAIHAEIIVPCEGRVEKITL
jgi:hypothetical protein